MQVKTADGITDITVTTVTLSHDTHDPTGNHMYMFHCPVCGSPVVQYSGFIARLMPGMEPVTLPIVARCTNTKRCTAKYLFRTIV